MFKKLVDKLRFRESYIEEAVVVEDPSSVSWDREVDLVVAGFGGAGAAAAIEAHDQGLETLILDRFSGGGATNISGGIYYAGGGTPVQQQAGIADSSDNMANYLRQEVQGAVSEDTLQMFCEQSLDNYSWMQENGVPFDASLCPFKTSYPPNNYFLYYSGNESFSPYKDLATPAARGHRAHKPGISGNAIYQPLKASAISKGIDIQTQSKVVSLLTNSDGDVIGLKAIQLSHKPVVGLLHKAVDMLHIALRYTALFWPPLFNLFAAMAESLETRFGRHTYIRARKGVVLATGGFYSNQAMVKKYAPKFLGGSPLGTMGDDGSGIQMAMDVGAKTELMDSVSAWRFINPPSSFVKGIMVGPSGKRVCNEMLYGAQLGEKIMSEHDGSAWVILDEKTYKASAGDLTLKKGLYFHLILGWFYRKLGVKKANSIVELANSLAIDSQTMLETVAEYNRIANSDELDPEGKPKEYMPALGDGPYYAINASYHYFYVPCPSLTFGGLAVNETSGLVKHKDGYDIQGLYAAGRTAVGIPSRGYVSGLSIADCIFSGRRAAAHAAQQQFDSEKIAA